MDYRGGFRSFAWCRSWGTSVGAIGEAANKEIIWRNPPAVAGAVRCRRSLRVRVAHSSRLARETGE